MTPPAPPPDLAPSPESPWPRVVSVRRSSEHDGPGLRSVVFLKGCRLRCVFCHNPETQDPREEIAFRPARCIGCGHCATACDQGAIRLGPGERIHRERCIRCGACAEACPPNALERLGRPWAPEALAEVLREDRAFYHHSGGGVTFTGGECLLHPEYLAAVIRELRLDPREPAIHVALETGGHFHWGAARDVLEQVNLVYFDLKLADGGLHRAHTGRGSGRIQENLRRTVALGVPVEVRIPVVPGITDDDDNLRALAGIARDVGVARPTLLPYNPAGLDSYARIGREPPALPRRFVEPEAWQELQARFRRFWEERGGRWVEPEVSPATGPVS